MPTLHYSLHAHEHKVGDPSPTRSETKNHPSFPELIGQLLNRLPFAYAVWLIPSVGVHHADNAQCLQITYMHELNPVPNALGD